LSWIARTGKQSIKEEKMRALFGKTPFEFQWRDLPIPQPEFGQVQVRVEAGGICGTDLHFLRHNEEWTPLGHEAVGVIEEMGEGVGGFECGERVIVENHAACGVCEQCKNGRSLYCQNLTTYMEDQAGFSDYLVVRSDMLHRYDGERLKTIHACLAEPLTVALDITLRADPGLNDEVVVFGPGPIGLMVVRLAKLRGARRVFLIGSNRSTPRGMHRLDVGRQMGADVTLGYEEDDVVGDILAAVPDGVDRVFVTAPPKTLVEAIEISRFGGIIAFNGIEFGKGGEVTFDANAFHFKKLQLRASHAIPNHYFPMAIDLLSRRAVDPEPLLSYTFLGHEAEKAFQTLIDPEEQAVKVAIQS
jgi:L-iditol 2-dehydrogenase